MASTSSLGVATTLTPMAFFEIVMLKAYEALVDPHTKVDVSAGMIAAPDFSRCSIRAMNNPTWPS